MTERIRGRKAVALRRRRLEADPLCRDCKASGLIRAAEEIDHVIPLSKGGDDGEGNWRPLCKPCHLKRGAEQFGHQHRPKRRIGLDGWPVDE